MLENENLSNSFLSLGEALDQSQKEKNVSLELAELEKFLQDFSTKTVNDAKSSVKKLIQANIVY